MSLRKILVPVLPGVPAATQLEASLALARRLHAHIDAVFLRPNPAQDLIYDPAMMVTAGFVEQLEAQASESEAEAGAAFEAWRTAHGVSLGRPDRLLSTVFAGWSAETGLMEASLARHGRLSDLIVLNRPDAGNVSAARAFDVAAFDTGRPTLLVRDALPANMLHHVVVAWNGSMEATRALTGAMTLLEAAERVSIFCPDPDAGELDRLRDYLSWHMIRPQLLAVPAGSGPVGATLLDAAAGGGATLLVMGAFTHSRVRQMLLGGVTRHVLDHAALPVLMTH